MITWSPDEIGPCQCRLCEGESASADWIDEHVETTGWAVVGVRSDHLYAYTIGLWHSFRLPELAMFGLSWPDIGNWLNTAVALHRERVVILDDDPFEGVITGVPVMLRHADPSWSEPLFCQMTEFYRGLVPAVRQLIWPDRHGLWPWDEGASTGCREDQPRAWQPVNTHLDGPWRLIGELSVEWEFWPAGPDTEVIASRDVVTGRRPIDRVLRAGEDWAFFDERGATDDADHTLVLFGQLVRAQPWLRRFQSLPDNTEATRQPDGTWRQTPLSRVVTD
jgi:hypothetical protein